MTSQEQAKAIVETYNCNPLNQSIVDSRSNDWLCHHITQALDAARRETWEQAAQEADRLLMPTAVNVQFIAWCRAQATAQADKEA